MVQNTSHFPLFSIINNVAEFTSSHLPISIFRSAANITHMYYFKLCIYVQVLLFVATNRIFHNFALSVN
jgi:hypothetical protein